MQEPPTNARIQRLLKLHYIIMEESSFWNDRALQEASKILCKAASDERVKLIKDLEEAKQKEGKPAV